MAAVTEEALSALTENLNSVSLIDDQAFFIDSTKLPDKVLLGIFNRLDPHDYHRVAPRVCRRFHKLIRLNPTTKLPNPRVILLNVHLLVPKTPTPAGPAIGSGRCRCTPPLPLDTWTPLPTCYVDATQVRTAGEGLVVQANFDRVPVDRAGLAGFLNCTLAALVGRLPRSDSHSPNVSVVPWEVTVLSPLRSDEDKVRLAAILARLSPRVVTIVSPPPDVMSLLPPSIVAVRLENILRRLDFAPVERLENLAKLEIDGPLGGIEGQSDSDSDSDVSITPATVNGAPTCHLAPLATRKSTLQTLRIGQWYPLTSYTTLIPTLCKMSNLHLLHIKGLYQGDQIPSDLANLFCSLTTLREFDAISDVDQAFWDAVKDRLAKANTQLSIRRLVLEYTEPSIDVISAAIRSVSTLVPSCLQLMFRLHGNGKEVETDAVLEVLEEIRKSGRRGLRNVVIRGVTLPLGDIPKIAEFNFRAPGGGVTVSFRGVTL
ncbi:hypothetical protein HK104_009969 [Borealophlyctis nickersoniae]|nr:hypothetical protein HK104_009969 [Borealophlyctis nickersoniae]